MTQAFHYEGFSSPNGTIVPDDVFDLLAPRLSEAELRVLLYIIRRTFGFKKESDSISLKQMVEGITKKDGSVMDLGAGVVKSAATRAVRGLVEKGVVIATRNRSAEKGDEPTRYQLRFRAQPVFSKRTRGVPPKEHGGVLLENPQETVLQETVRQQTERESHPHSSDEILISNIRNGNALVFQTKDKEPRADHKAFSLEQTPDATSPLPLPYAPTQSHRGFQTPAAILQRRSAPRDDVASEARQAIGSYMRDFALEFGDQAPLRSTISRAVRLYENSGLSLSVFIGYLHSARSQTKEYSGSIRKGRGDRSKGWQPANKVPYFFAVLEDQLGFREHTDREPTPLLPQQAALPMPPSRREAPSRSDTDRPRSSIGGPRVRVVPLRTEEHEDADTASDSITPLRGRSAPQNRPKSRRLPLRGTDAPPGSSSP